VPTLAEVAALTRGRIQLDVELKEPIGAATLDILFKGGFASNDFVVTSFDAASLRPVIDDPRAVRTGLLTEETADVLTEFRLSGTAFLAPSLAIVDTTLLSRAEAHSIPLLPWTVNDPTDIERLLKAPAVTGVITDRLAAAIERRASGAIGPILL
jgi:glycerophosphoryl diester phosphodiesterase